MPLSKPRAAQFVVASAALLVVGALWLAGVLHSGMAPDVPMGILAACLAVAFFANVRGDLVTPLNVAIAFFLFSYELGSESQIATGNLYPDQFVTKALFLVTFCFLGFWAGYCVPVRRGTWRIPDRLTLPMQRGRLMFTGVVVLGLSVGLLVTYLALAGGGSYFSAALYGQRIEATRGRYFVTWGITFALALPILWYTHGRFGEKEPSLGFRVALIAFLIAGLILVFPLGARTPLLYPILSLVVCRNYLNKRIGLRSLLLASTGLAVAAVAYQLHRYWTLGYLSLEDVPRFLGDRATLWRYFSAEWMVLGDLARAVSVWPTFRPFMLGQSYLMLFVTPIPRLLWPSKPSWEVSYLMNVEIYGPDQASVWGGRALGMVGEGYVNFGVPGAIVIAFLVGLVSCYAYQRVCERRHSSIVAPIYAAFLYSLFIALRGELAAGIIQFVQFLVPLLVIYVFASYPPRPSVRTLPRQSVPT